MGSAILALATLAGRLDPAAGNLVVRRHAALVARRARGQLVRVEVRSIPSSSRAKSYVFLANHQSLFDIPVLLATSPGQVRMMAKRSLFLIPLFGWALKAGGFIPVDRADRSTARQSFSSAFARLREGTSILLFPEGTRSLDDTLLPFQRGGFLLAMKSGLPIVPVGIQGTRAIQRQGSLAIRPGTVVVTYGAPIDPAAYGVRRKRELTARCGGRIAEPGRAGVAEDGEAHWTVWYDRPWEGMPP